MNKYETRFANALFERKNARANNTNTIRLDKDKIQKTKTVVKSIGLGRSFQIKNNNLLKFFLSFYS
ncbi:MAG: hypothetical protein WA395_06585 [Nitrososphaeraceae archaeon]